MNAFDLDRMTLAVKVFEERSFSRAAAVLGITQPAVSQQIRIIEEGLGRRVFKRSTGGLSLTEDGEAYLLYARAMIKIGEEAERHFSGRSGGERIRLGLAEDFSRTVLPVALALFTRAHPNFEIEINCGVSLSLLSGLDEGRYDAVVVKRPRGRTSGERLWCEEMAWYGRADTPHPLPDPLDVVMISGPCRSRDLVLDALRRSGLSWRPKFQSLTFSLLETAVRAGVGVGVFCKNLHSADLVELDPKFGLPPVDPMEIVFVGSEKPAPLVEPFYNVVREATILSVGCGAEGTIIDDASE